MWSRAMACFACVRAPRDDARDARESEKEIFYDAPSSFERRASWWAPTLVKSSEVEEGGLETDANGDGDGDDAGDDAAAGARGRRVSPRARAGVVGDGGGVSRRVVRGQGEGVREGVERDGDGRRARR